MLSLARTWVQFLVGELRSRKPHGEVKTKSLEQEPGVFQSEQDIAHSPPDMGPSQEFRSWGLEGHVYLLVIEPKSRTRNRMSRRKNTLLHNGF